MFKLCRIAIVRFLDTLGLKSSTKRLLLTARNSGIRKSEPRIIQALHHDSSAFTQGLYIHNGILYESTGLVGHSSLRVIDRETGEIQKCISVSGQFAEGIAVLDDRLVQLLWRSQKALVYSVPDLTPLEHYCFTGEGWGMTATAEYFLVSNGTNEIVYRDKNFNRIKSLKVRVKGFRLNGINDLAWVNGRIYCNVLRDNNIYVIRESTGKVINVIDCSNLAEVAATPGYANVLNGIAYDSQTDTFLITGKRWKKYYQVKLKDSVSGY